MVREPEDETQDLQGVSREDWHGRTEQASVPTSPDRPGMFNFAETAIVTTTIGLLAMVAVPAYIETKTISREMLSRNSQRQVDALKKAAITDTERSNMTLEKVPGMFMLTALADSYFQAMDRDDFDEALRILNSREFKRGQAAARYFSLRSEMNPLVTEDDLTTLEAMTGIHIESHGDLYVAMNRSYQAKAFVYSGIKLMEAYPESVKSSRLEWRQNPLHLSSHYVLYVMTLGRSARFDRPSQVGITMGVALLILMIAIVGRRMTSTFKRRRLLKRSFEHQSSSLDPT